MAAISAHLQGVAKISPKFVAVFLESLGIVK